MARKTARKAVRKTAPDVPRKTAQRLRKVKGPGTRLAADTKAAAGALPQWTTAEIEEAFRRFHAADPEPEGELEHINPFTLLVAVVLSAQATDKSVNQATAELFVSFNTPEKIAGLGAAGLEKYIRRIGLFRTKARNVVALSKIILKEHAGDVPSTREALEHLPGVGRKTANVVLNTAFGQPTVAVDTHIFRVANRTGLAPGKGVLEVEQKLLRFTPPEFLKNAHHWLILHGRYVCLARKPRCPQCLIRDLCEFRGKTKDV